MSKALAMPKNLLRTEGMPFRKAEKTKPIQAKPISAIVTDPSLAAQLLLKTLEGSQELAAGSVVCRGAEGEPWQQKPAKLLQKYTLASIAPDGWMTFNPIPGVQENAVQVTAAMLAAAGVEGDSFCVQGQWGEPLEVGGGKIHVQHGTVGDYVFQSPADASDIWIVRKSFFDATYTFVG